MISDIEKRFPFDAYPEGWFQVVYSREASTEPEWELPKIPEFRAWTRQSYEEAFA